MPGSKLPDRMGESVMTHQLTVDPLAIAGAVGFGTLILVMAGITIWVLRQSGKSSGEK